MATQRTDSELLDATPVTLECDPNDERAIKFHDLIVEAHSAHQHILDAACDDQVTFSSSAFGRLMRRYETAIKRLDEHCRVKPLAEATTKRLN